MFDDLHNAEGERLDAAFHPGDEGRRDLVVLGHGVTANKDRPFVVALAEELARRGIASLRFSFAGNGASEGDFRAATISKEVEDLGAVLDRLDDWRVGYAGHSMGGAVGVLRSSRDPRIRALVSLAGMVHTADFAERKFGDLTPGRDCMWDKPECPLSQAYVDDMAAIGSVVDRGAEIRVPWLLVHGSGDQVVPIRDATDIVARALGGAQLVELDGADHVFSGAAVTQEMAQVVSDWFTDLWS
ncbi:MAG: alpha/beta fold hydrolase [Planctomycetota bacterium]